MNRKRVTSAKSELSDASLRRLAAGKAGVREEGRCRHPREARPAMEACGIDVYSTVKRAGFEISVVRTTDQCPDYFGLVLVD